jgi:predicted component of type VI protein secretion system
VELLITVGRARQRIRRVTGPVFLIGSAMDCDLILGDALVPSVHSYILVTAQGVRLRHLGAAPEIRINGQPLEVVRLEDLDQIDIGQFSFEVRIYGPVPGQLPSAAASLQSPLSICRGTDQPSSEPPQNRQRCQ